MMKGNKQWNGREREREWNDNKTSRIKRIDKDSFSRKLYERFNFVKKLLSITEMIEKLMRRLQTHKQRRNKQLQREQCNNLMEK